MDFYSCIVMYGVIIKFCRVCVKGSWALYCSFPTWIELATISLGHTLHDQRPHFFMDLEYNQGLIYISPYGITNRKLQCHVYPSAWAAQTHIIPKSDRHFMYKIFYRNYASQVPPESTRSPPSLTCSQLILQHVHCTCRRQVVMVIFSIYMYM